MSLLAFVLVLQATFIVICILAVVFKEPLLMGKSTFIVRPL